MQVSHGKGCTRNGRLALGYYPCDRVSPPASIRHGRNRLPQRLGHLRYLSSAITTYTAVATVRRSHLDRSDGNAELAGRGCIRGPERRRRLRVVLQLHGPRVELRADARAGEPRRRVAQQRRRPPRQRPPVHARIQRRPGISGTNPYAVLPRGSGVAWFTTIATFTRSATRWARANASWQSSGRKKHGCWISRSGWNRACSGSGVS